nr:MAG TPA: hypothetical protein [Caudoviricetes sp.]
MSKGGWTKDGKVYCCLCGNITSDKDIGHGGAVVEMEAMRYPFCSKCVSRKDEQIIKAVKARRRL